MVQAMSSSLARHGSSTTVSWQMDLLKRGFVSLSHTKCKNMLNNLYLVPLAALYLVPLAVLYLVPLAALYLVPLAACT